MSMPQPLRVAQVMGKMVGGGVESVVMNYYRHVDRSTVQFDFIVDSDSTIVPADEIGSLGGKVFEVPPYQHVLAYQRALEELFREQGWRIVHSHLNALSVFPLMAAKRAGVPVRIAHSHSTAGMGEPARNAVKRVLRLFSKVYPTDLAACGTYAGEWLFGKGADFTVFPNAIELGRFAFDPTVREEVRQELGIADLTFAIGHLGRFVSQKNHEFLVRAFARLHEEAPDSVLLFAGAGPLRERAESLAIDLGIQDSVRFLGQRGDADRLYQAFDVFALPSLYEGFCVVGVEAQAAGLPCLFSDAVTREVGLDPRSRFLPLDEKTWVDALVKIRDGCSGSRVMASAVRAYDIGAAAGKLQDYYLACVGRLGE